MTLIILFWFFNTPINLNQEKFSTIFFRQNSTVSLSMIKYDFIFRRIMILCFKRNARLMLKIPCSSDL